MKQLRNQWKSWPISDWPLALLIVLLAWLIGPGWIAESEHRADLYTACIGASATLFGFIAASLTILQGIGDGPRIQSLRKNHGAVINKTMVSMLTALALMLGAAVFALATDRQITASGTVTLFRFFLVLTGIRLARILWLMTIVLNVQEQDRVDGDITSNRQIPRAPIGH